MVHNEVIINVCLCYIKICLEFPFPYISVWHMAARQQESQCGIIFKILKQYFILYSNGVLS